MSTDQSPLLTTVPVDHGQLLQTSRSSRTLGGFDPDDDNLNDASPADAEFAYDDELSDRGTKLDTIDDTQSADDTMGDGAASSTLQPDFNDSSTSLPIPSVKIACDDSDRGTLDDTSVLIFDESGDPHRRNNQTVLEEKEMQQKLMDMESSFLPEPSTISIAPQIKENAGVDDAYLVGVTGEGADPAAVSITTQTMERVGEQKRTTTEPRGASDSSRPETDGASTPHGLARVRCSPLMHDPDDNSTAFRKQGERDTSLPEPSDSPTADAAARNASRPRSTVSQSTNDTIDHHSEDCPRQKLQVPGEDDDMDATPKRSRRNLSPNLPGLRSSRDTSDVEEATNILAQGSERKRTRLRFLSSRQSTHRFSTSSINSTATDVTNGDTTLGADYALQSGGAVPGDSQGSRHKDLTRSISLGSVASGISGYSDDNLIDKRVFSGVTTDGGLHTLDEEDPPPQSRPSSSSKKAGLDNSAPVTPKAHTRDLPLPPDTVVTENIQVPGILARQFRETYGPGISPEKRSSAPTSGFGRSGKSMTLKEQSSTIDRLSKENFDLKMRIHFLNEALNKRSEEGIKEMISENVELKSDKLKLQKENQSLKRMIRDLENQLRDRDQLPDRDSTASEGPGASDDEDRNIAAEEEILFLKERIETFEVEIERLRSESLVRESEKRRLAEIVKSLGDSRPGGSEAGAREERDMWKDMLDAETAAREQAEEQNRKLRDEILRMKTEVNFSDVSGRVSRRGQLPSVVSQSTSSDRDLERKLGVSGSTASTLVELELLKQENAELRREVSAQTSMLTSRNREKERLYQEIEDLKLGQRRDGNRSVAGDSIFERSASRSHVRSSSRASDGTRASRVSDAERENLEIRNGELRDQVSALKLENQNIRGQLEEAMNDLEALDKAYQADVEQVEEEMQALQQERDLVLQVADEQGATILGLQAEAQEEIDALGDDLDQKIDQCQRLEVELRNQQENLKALQAEMRSASEGIIRLEEDAQSNLQKYKAVQQELNDANREVESLMKSLFEANNKVQRLTVQQESSQNEIAFLREEQDGDKIKIGDLESELKTCQLSLQNERERTKEVENSLAEERHQREVVGSKEKQEVQRMMAELNREASAAKEEVRKLRKNLSARETEATTWKERFMDLENGLREALGDLNGTRSSLLNSIIKLQKELESTALELESTRAKLDEKDTLLKNRDALLESHGLESRKLADLLERERQARRADKHSFEQALKSHQQASRAISQNHSRISDLENARSQDRKRYANLEQQYKDQLSERNSLFLTLWKRLSTMCGPDWAHSNSLITGNLPSLEVIGNILFWPGFSRNLLLAVKTVETMVAAFRTRIKAIERDLTKEYQTLEHTIGLRIKKLDRLEDAVKNIRSHQRSSSNPSPELSKLRGENRLLRAELNLLQAHSRSRNSTAASGTSTAGGKGSERSGSRNSPQQGSPVNTTSSIVARHHPSSSAERSAGGAASRSGRSGNKSMVPRSSTGIPPPTHASLNPGAVEPLAQWEQGASELSQELWLHRLRYMERRLRAEREARLLDRSGARKRLEERNAENKALRAQLQRERLRWEMSNGMLPANNRAGRSRSSSAGQSQDSADEEKLLSVMDRHGSDQGDDEYEDGHHEGDRTPSSYEGEGFRVDIEI